MSEDVTIAAVQSAINARGIEDAIVAAGQFEPRGHTGALFAGGLAGETAGGDVGLADGSLGLPWMMLVGVSERAVYGFAACNRHDEPTDLAFKVGRADLVVKVHRRMGVRVLELIDHASGSCIELEGSRIALTHSKDVIEALRLKAGA